MGLILLNKFLLLILFLSLLNVLKEIGMFLWNWLAKATPTPLNLSSKRVFLLGLSFSYILLWIFNGIKI
jgi:hypothetical protein|tara:strand:+ start:536 stop:742 length:207 start_codon:yes stop_codon:yes gene_type:complete